MRLSVVIGLAALSRVALAQIGVFHGWFCPLKSKTRKLTSRPGFVHLATYFNYIDSKFVTYKNPSQPDYIEHQLLCLYNPKPDQVDHRIVGCEYHQRKGGLLKESRDGAEVPRANCPPFADYAPA